MKNRLLFTLLSAFCSVNSGVQAATVDLTGVGYVTYGDANSYSLAIANYYSACGKEMGKDCPYSVNGSPGQTDPFVKIVEGANGHQSNGTANMDDAFDAVNNPLYFTMTSSNEPAAGSFDTLSADRDGTWDATLGALNTKLDLIHNDMTFFFVNNEPNSQDGLTQSLAVWARITLTNLTGTTTFGTWDLTNDTRTAAQRTANSPTAPGYGPPPIGGGVPMGDVSLYTSEVNAPAITDFVMSGGQVCINKVSKVIVDCTTAAAGSYDAINHNLGENQAPYAVVVPELDAMIRGLINTSSNLDQYAMHVDVRYGCAPPFTISTQGKDSCDAGTVVSQDNNFEQIFIGTREATQQVPEPETLALLGLGLFGIGLARRRKH
jgi:hypothetical protein